MTKPALTNKPSRKFGRNSNGNISLREAALLAFAEHGFAGTGIRAIMKTAVPMSPACIYLHFGDKAGLYRAITDDLIDELEAHIANSARSHCHANRADPLELTRQVLAQLAAYLLDPAFRVKARFLTQDALFGLYVRDEARDCALLRIGTHLVEQVQADGEELDPESEAGIAALPGQIVALASLSGLNAFLSGRDVSAERTAALVRGSASALIERVLSRLGAEPAAISHVQGEGFRSGAKHITGRCGPHGSCDTKLSPDARSVAQRND